MDADCAWSSLYVHYINEVHINFDIKGIAK